MSLAAVLDLVPGFGPVRAIAGFIGRPLAALWRWLAADWRNPFLLIFIGFTVWHSFVTIPALRMQRDSAESALVSEQDAHQQTVERFEQAARAAEQSQAGNLVRVAGEQAAITERVTDAYQDSLADLRARAEQLRRSAKADTGLSGDLPLPAASAATGRAAAPPSADRLPATGSTAAIAAMNLEERVIASEQALQLNALIDWIEGQSRVVNSPREPAP